MASFRPYAQRLAAALLLGLVLWPMTGEPATLAEVETLLADGDHARAAALLEPLAAGGSPTAQFQLGTLHSLGRGMPVDHARAAAWFAKASASGHHEATVTLANMYLSGLGVERDEARAVALFERAAEIAEQQEIEDEEC